MELFRALGALVDAPCSENRLIGHLLELGTLPDEPEHNELFLFQLYPYASSFLGPDGRLGGEARDRVAGFWRALEAEPPSEPDHLGTLLAAYADLIDRESEAGAGPDAEAWRRVRHACLWEHLLSWVLPYLEKVRAIAPPFYRRWADTLETALDEEANRLGPPDRTPLALRESQPVPDPRSADGTSFLSALLSPVRSGMVLTRGDLARAGRDLGFGLRIGERAYILKAMMSQGPRETLDWLAAEAASWQDRHTSSAVRAIEVNEFWSTRARRTAELLEDLHVDVVGSLHPDPSSEAASS